MSQLITPNDELSKIICVSCVDELERVRKFFDQCFEANRSQIIAHRQFQPSPLDLETHLNQYVRSFNPPLVPQIKMEPSALCDIEWGRDSGDENDENYAPESQPCEDVKPAMEVLEAVQDILDETQGLSIVKKRKRRKVGIKHCMEENLNRPMWPCRDETPSDEELGDKATKKKVIRKKKLEPLALSTCSKCQTSFLDHQANLEHWKENHKEAQIQYNCQEDKCEFNSAECEEIIAHQIELHPTSTKGKRIPKKEGKLEDCKVCGKSYPTTYLYSRHMLSHSDQKNFKCHVCEKDFKSTQDLKIHIKVHGTFEEKYTHCCELCGKRFTQRSNLDSHLRVHSGYKPYNCDFCEKTFSQKGNMEEHRRTHTGEKPFVCELCGSPFARRSELQLHLRCVHTGDRPYQCAFCPKNFQRRDLLRKHERIHTDTRPYQCQYCQKAFTQRDKMVVHTRLHTGERPYVCNICNKGFCESGNLKKHLRVHGKQAPAVMHQNNKGKPAPGSVNGLLKSDGGNMAMLSRMSNTDNPSGVQSASETNPTFMVPKEESGYTMAGHVQDRSFSPSSQHSGSARGTPLPSVSSCSTSTGPNAPVVPKIETGFAFPMNLQTGSMMKMGDDQSETGSERSVTPNNPPQPAHLSNPQIPYAAMHPLMQQLSEIRESWYGQHSGQNNPGNEN
ncbi:zinc finger protein 70-like isoform X2 [Tigriopus californicus]|uniref:zinc finger protein 70-like isoform X2 n=1 Tax=Tigriopus californicus TaxID=6832 RepID=UPI0027DA5B6F|nr:zinc finger protein 70-like isoform X2 [Tigriopus californicus]